MLHHILVATLTYGGKSVPFCKQNPTMLSSSVEQCWLTKVWSAFITQYGGYMNAARSFLFAFQLSHILKKIYFDGNCRDIDAKSYILGIVVFAM